MHFGRTAGRPPLKAYGVIVIDMLNDYLTSTGASFSPAGRVIIPYIARLSDFVRKNGGSIFYVNTELARGDLLAERWGLHAVKGTIGARVVSELTPQPNDAVVTKKFYNGFFNTQLDRELRAKKIETVLLTGIHTHVCVLLTGVGAFEHGYRVVAPDDCFTTGYKANHESRLRFFGSHLGTLTTSTEWMASITAG